MGFKSWAIEKKVTEHDLVFLRGLKSPLQLDLFHKVADQVAGLAPTFSEGLKTFEILIDLILMGHNEILLEKLQNLDIYSAHLKSLRYPMTSQRDDEMKSKFEALPWPSGSKIKFERRGDRAGVECKLFISSEVDLTKIIAAFERIQKELSQ